MVDFNRIHGSVSLPVPVPPNNARTLESFSPGRLLADVFAAGIRADLTAAMKSAGRDTMFANLSAVEHLAATEPTREYIETTGCKFPALFVYYSPEEELEEEQMTRQVRKIRQTWNVEYILGALAPDNRERFEAAVLLARAITSEILRVGGHPAYKLDPSGTTAARVFEAAGYYDLGVGRMLGYGSATFDDGATKYFGGRWSVRLSVLSGPGEDYFDAKPLRGADFNADLNTVSLDGGENPPLVDFLQVSETLPGVELAASGVSTGSPSTGSPEIGQSEP